MKRKIRDLIDIILRKFGIVTIREYELSYLHEKFSLALTELTNLFFYTKTAQNIPSNDNRIKLLQRLYGTNIIEALYIIYYLHKSKPLNGDVCEFGTANGGTSSLIANEIKKTNKNLYLFDSFQGLSLPTKKDKMIDDIFKLGSMDKYKGSMSYSETEVLNKLKSIKFPKSRLHIVKGFIEETIKYPNLPKKISFAYLDFDLYEPTLITLNFLDKALINNGSVIVDDYNFFSLGVKRAVDEFIKNKKNYKIIFSKKYEGNFCIITKVF